MVEKEVSEGILGWQHRRLTLGTILAISVVAFEALALATVAPVIAPGISTALDSMGGFSALSYSLRLSELSRRVNRSTGVDQPCLSSSR